MIINKLSLLASAITMALSLTACGGGSGGSSASSSSSTGVITGFGSIFVNGIEYETRNSNIMLDGQPASEDELAVGMVVDIRGTHDNSKGTALSINSADELEGIVQTNSIPTGAGSGTLVIMGQSVTVTAETIFESKLQTITSVDAIASGNIVEVHGFSDGTGEIFASRIEVKAQDLSSYLAGHSEGMEVKGVVSNLDTVNNTFSLGNMTVNFAAADNRIPSLADGLYVEVKSTQGIDTNNQLIASKLEIEDDGKPGHQGRENEDFEIKGILSTDLTSNSFVIDGITVMVDSLTKFKDLDTGSLMKGVMVEIEGAFDATGKLIANEIKAENRADSEIKAMIADIVPTGLNSGSLTLADAGSTEIIITSKTLMKDSRDGSGTMPEKKFNMSFLMIGDFIEVDVFTNSDGKLEAAKIEREDNS